MNLKNIFGLLDIFIVQKSSQLAMGDITLVVKKASKNVSVEYKVYFCEVNFILRREINFPIFPLYAFVFPFGTSI